MVTLLVLFKIPPVNRFTMIIWGGRKIHLFRKSRHEQMLLKANCENVYMTQNSRVCLLTGNILYVRPNIYIFENKKIEIFTDQKIQTKPTGGHLLIFCVFLYFLKMN